MKWSVFINGALYMDIEHPEIKMSGLIPEAEKKQLEAVGYSISFQDLHTVIGLNNARPDAGLIMYNAYMLTHPLSISMRF